MSEDIYRDAIIDLAKSKKGSERLFNPDITITLDNPLCGDRITLDVNLANGRVTKLGYKVRGCILCEAAASMIGEHAPNTEVTAITPGRRILTSILKKETTATPTFAPVAEFAPVAQFKSRHECVLLPFEALEKAVIGALE